MITKYDTELVSLFVIQPDDGGNIVISDDFLRRIMSISPEEIYAIIWNHRDELLPITAANIPQFSNLDDVDKVMQILIESGSSEVTFQGIGYYLCTREAKAGAQTKYGENHYKTAASLGLTVFGQKNLKPTKLGMRYYTELNSEERLEVRKRLALRVPLIQQALLQADDIVDMKKMMLECLSLSTVLRRGSNIRTLLRGISDIAGPEIQHKVSNLIWS